MGWWAPDIMGGDTPLDFKGNFEDRFGSLDEEFNKWRLDDGKEPIEFRVPTSEETLEFIQSCRAWKWYSGSEDPVLLQVTGFLVIERGGQMNDELRAEVLRGIDEEIAEGCEEWNNPQERITCLQEFRKVVEAYPAEGAKVEVPHQRGLFEMFAQKVGPGLINAK